MGSKSKTLALILVVFFIMPLAITQPVNSQSGASQITISADGTVTGTNSIQRNGNTYTITTNLNATIVIEKDNITLDGGGFGLQGSESMLNQFNLNLRDEPQNITAINLVGRTGDTIRNLKIMDFAIGVGLYNSTNCVVSDNSFSNIGYPGAIYLVNSTNNWVNKNNINADGISGVWLYEGNSNFISGNRIANGSQGILVIGSNNTVSANSLSNYQGVGNTGIVASGLYNTVIDNNITGESIGIEIQDGLISNISRNNILKSGEAFDCDRSSNVFFENNIADCGYVINEDGGGYTNNTFYSNNFVNITAQNVVFANEFYMNHTYPSPQVINTHNFDNGTIGNYWSDYLAQNPNAKEINGIGTYTIPYTITTSNYPFVFYDYHPLVSPVIFSQNETIIPSWVTPTSTPSTDSSVLNLAIPIIAVAILAVATVSVLLHRGRQKTVNLNQ